MPFPTTVSLDSNQGASLPLLTFLSPDTMTMMGYLVDSKIIRVCAIKTIITIQQMLILMVNGGS